MNLKLVMGPGQKFLTQVGSGQFLVARVVSVIYGLGLDSPKTVKFIIFSLSVKKISLGWSKSTRVKGGSVSYLLQVKSMLASWPFSTLGALLSRIVLTQYNRTCHSDDKLME